jgi:hypothetical protein
VDRKDPRGYGACDAVDAWEGDELLETMMASVMLAKQSATELPFEHGRVPKLPTIVVMRDGTEKENIRMFAEN